jgi:hypothetical protein
LLKGTAAPLASISLRWQRSSFQLPAVEAVAAALAITGARGPSHLVTPQHRADAREEFSQAERLDDVIVGAELKADDAIDFVGPLPGGDDDRHIATRTDFSQQIEPIVLTEAKVENDQTGLCCLKMAAQFSPIGRSPGRHIVLFQISDHHLPHGRIVINNNDMTYICQHIALLNWPPQAGQA